MKTRICSVILTLTLVSPLTSTPEPPLPAPHLYTRIFIGEQVGYRDTPYARSIFVRPSGDSSAYYALIFSTNMTTWTDARVGGRGLFLIRIETNPEGPMFFRFVKR